MKENNYSIISNTIPQYGSFNGVSVAGRNEIEIWENKERQVSGQRFISGRKKLILKSLKIESNKECFVIINETKKMKIIPWINQKIETGNEKIYSIKFNDNVNYHSEYFY